MGNVRFVNKSYKSIILVLMEHFKTYTFNRVDSIDIINHANDCYVIGQGKKTYIVNGPDTVGKPIDGSEIPTSVLKGSNTRVKSMKSYAEKLKSYAPSMEEFANDIDKSADMLSASEEVIITRLFSKDK